MQRLLSKLWILSLLNGCQFSSNSPKSHGKEFPGVVVTNGYECARIGANILSKGGTAVDAAIGALFCEGLKLPQSTGIGGGFLMTIYDAKSRKAVNLNARETAPKAATRDMFNHSADLAKKGILSVAVPGELRGYKEAYEKYGGGVSWEDLVQPSIELLDNGVLITPYFANVLKTHEEMLKTDVGLKRVFFNTEQNRTLETNERYKNTKLVETLRIIAYNGPDALHNGPLTKPFIDEIIRKGGIITEDDLKEYQVKWSDALTVELDGEKQLHTAPLPGSGVILSYIINTLSGFIKRKESILPETWQKVVESFKYGYGRRTQLGDITDSNEKKMSALVSSLMSHEVAEETRRNISKNLNETFSDPKHYGAETDPVTDHGTAHICVLASNGDAVSVTSTINLIFGSGILLDDTGIILNDEMDDFSSPGMHNDDNLPPSEANFISPNKRPLSSMVPSIVTDRNGNIEMVVGAAGGSKITTSVALTIMNYLTFGYNITAAINLPRIHHQLFPMVLEMEQGYCTDESLMNIHEFLCKSVKHNCTCEITDGFSAVTAIVVKDRIVSASTDIRRQGEVAFAVEAPNTASTYNASLVLIVLLINMNVFQIPKI